MSINTYTILQSEQYSDAVEVIFWHGRSDYKAHIRIAKMDGVDGGVSIHDLTKSISGADGIAFIPPSVIVEAMEMLGCVVPEDSYFRACHKASGSVSNTCRDNMCDTCPERERTQELPQTLFAAHRRIEAMQRDYDRLVKKHEGEGSDYSVAEQNAFGKGEEHCISELQLAARTLKWDNALENIVHEAGYLLPVYKTDNVSDPVSHRIEMDTAALAPPKAFTAEDDAKADEEYFNNVETEVKLGQEQVLNNVVQRLEELAADCRSASADVMTLPLSTWEKDKLIEEATRMAYNGKTIYNLAQVIYLNKEHIIEGNLIELPLSELGDILEVTPVEVVTFTTSPA